MDSLQNQIGILFTFYLLATGFSVMINYLILRFSKNLGIRNLQQDNLIRWGSTSKPSLGGFSFYIVFLLSVATLGYFSDDTGYFDKQMVGLMGACSLAFLIGMADDAYNTNPLVKFIGQFACANVLVATGYQIELTTIQEINYIFTVLWIIGLMNSINMLDNMDAITTTTAISILLGVITIITLNESVSNAYLILMVGMLGALTGFLFFNWHPSKMYMGDTGSQFLGVFLAGISILFLWNYRQPEAGEIQLRQFILPVAVFLVPIIDTTTVFIRRIARKQSPFVGGKDHITHHLAYAGLSDRMVAILLWCISLFSVFLVYWAYNRFDDWKPTYTYWILGYFLLVFVIFQIIYDYGKKRQQSVRLNENVSE